MLSSPLTSSIAAGVALALRLPDYMFTIKKLRGRGENSVPNVIPTYSQGLLGPAVFCVPL